MIKEQDQRLVHFYRRTVVSLVHFYRRTVGSVLHFYRRTVGSVLHFKLKRGRRGRDRMVVGFTFTYAISADHH
jgi:hypothetical protein